MAPSPQNNNNYKRDEAQAVANAAKYILDTLSEQKHNPHFYAHVVFMYAGDGQLEARALQKAKEVHANRNPGSKPLKFGNVYLIDVDIELIPKDRINKFNDLAKNPLFCSFADMVKVMYSSKVRDFKYAVCLGINPQHGSITVRTRANGSNNTRAILNAMEVPINYAYPGQNPSLAAQHTFFKAGKKPMMETIGLFYRLWMYHFEKGFAYIWRDHRVCRLKSDDLDHKVDPMQLNGSAFHKVVYDAAIAKCLVA